MSDRNVREENAEIRKRKRQSLLVLEANLEGSARTARQLGLTDTERLICGALYGVAEALGTVPRAED